MSASGNLPPQAYTREVLVKAYEWLSAQSPAVRERASSADTMVALYLQARRRHTNGEEPNIWESPTAASVEAFKTDLKNLAEGLRQFEESQTAPGPTAPPSQSATTEPSAGVTSPRPHAPPLRPPSNTTTPPEVDEWVAPTPDMRAQAAHPRWHQQTAQQLPPAVPTPVPATHTLHLDAKSKNWILDVQRRMNLSTESDALRAIIAVGYERLRDLLPHA